MLKTMISALAAAASAFACLAAPAHADPAKLTFAYFISDNGYSYKGAIEPLVKKVNALGKGVVEIKLVLNGELGPDPADQLRMVKEGVADIVFLIPGYTPDALPDHRVLELPGLFNDLPEATLIHTRLAAAGKLRGYEDLVVLGAFGTAPETFHSVKPVTSLDDLQGAKVRVNNVMEASALSALGITAAEYDITKVATGLAEGGIDAALLPPWPLVEFGAARIATHHYMLKTSSAPLAVVMNRKAFESLPPEAQAIIAQSSGEWLADQFIDTLVGFEGGVVDELKSNPRRTYTEPNEEDQRRANEVFARIKADWVAAEPHNAELLSFVEAELAKLRTQ